jgi:MFS family permease
MVPAVSGAPRPRAQRLATAAVFLAVGTGIGAWAASIPGIKLGLGLHDAALGIALLSLAGGAMAGMPLAGWLGHRFAPRRACTATGAGFALTLLLPGAADGLPGLIGAAALLGLFAGCVDVLMNAQATLIERRWGAAILSSFHGAYSAGGLLGAGGGGLLLGAGLSPRAVLAAAAGLVGAAVLGTALVGELPAIPGESGRPPPPAASGGFAWPDRALLGIGALACLAFMIEGAMADWSGLFLITVAGASPALGTAGFAAFSVAMATGRLAGDRAVRRLGGRAVMRAGASLAVAGFALALAAPSPLAGAIGFGLVGLGLSNVVPVLFSAAGRVHAATPSVGVALASGIGYMGMVGGPPVIGFAADAWGLRLALIIPLAAAAAIAAAAMLPGRRPAALQG